MGLRSPTTANVQVRLGRTQLGYAQPRIKTNLQNDKTLCLAKFEKYQVQIVYVSFMEFQRRSAGLDFALSHHCIFP